LVSLTSKLLKLSRTSIGDEPRPPRDQAVVAGLISFPFGVASQSRTREKPVSSRPRRDVSTRRSYKSQIMSDEPKRRPILSLKNPPKVALPEGPKKKPARAPAPPAPPPVQHDWKCKPCGAGFSVEATLA